MRDSALPVYIVDTHALFWYRSDPTRLSAAADAVFRLADSGSAVIIVPAIVVAELFYLTQKLGRAMSTAAIIADIHQSREFVFSPLGQDQLEALERVEGVQEMRDRLIAAETLVHRAPIVSRDDVLRGNPMVEVIW